MMSDHQVSDYGKFPSSWQKFTLAEVCEKKDGIQTGPFGSLLHQKDYLTVGTPIITVEHLGDNRIIHENIPYVSESDKNRLQKFLLKEDDIVFSRVGSVDRRVLVRKEENGWLFSGRCLRVRCNKKLVDPVFLSFYFGLSNFKEYVRNLAFGSTMPSLNTKLLSDILIFLPPINVQQKIAHILGSLDDKIELNQRMNKTLESIAQAIFKEWFVDSEDNKLWEKGQVRNLGNIITGKTPPTNDKDNYDGETPFITIPDMHGNMFVFITKKTLSEKGVQTQWSKTLPPFSICVSCIATPGLVSMNTKPSQANQQINSLVPKDKKSVFYFYFVLRRLGEEIRARGSGGSVLLNLNKRQFESLPVLLPPARLVHKFQELVEPILMRILSNMRESCTLASLRDALLPKLISGEVKVK